MMEEHKTGSLLAERRTFLRNFVVFIALGFAIGLTDLVLRVFKDKTLFCQEDCEFLTLLGVLGRIDFTIFAVLFPVLSLLLLQLMREMSKSRPGFLTFYFEVWALFATSVSAFAVGRMFFDYETYCLYPILFLFAMGMAGVFVLVSLERWPLLAVPVLIFVLGAVVQTDIGSVDRKIKNKHEVTASQAKCYLFVPYGCYDCSFVFKNIDRLKREGKKPKIGIVPPDEAGPLLRMFNIAHYPVLVVKEKEGELSFYRGFHRIKGNLKRCL